jgi:hypothetical protein
MKSRAVSSIVSGLVFSLLSAGVSTGAGAEGNVRMSQIERAGAVTQVRAESRRAQSFRSEKTDSWLCTYVSPFFCSTFPTLSTAPASPSAPVRGRN